MNCRFRRCPDEKNMSSYGFEAVGAFLFSFWEFANICPTMPHIVKRKVRTWTNLK